MYDSGIRPISSITSQANPNKYQIWVIAPHLDDNDTRDTCTLKIENQQIKPNGNLSGCLPKILITQIGHKIDFLQILCVNCTLSGYFKNTFRLGSKCFLQQFTRGSLGGQKCTFYWYKNTNFQ